MKNIHNFESFINEKVTSKSPNDVVTVDADLSYEDGDKKFVESIWKKFNLKVKPNGANGAVGHDITGKKKDILAYLQSEYYEMDDEDIKDIYPELMEGDELDEAMVQVAGKSKPSGAQVLATVLVDYMITKDFLKPGFDSTSMKKGLIQDLQKFIMENTF
jgi:hypothetical protein